MGEVTGIAWTDSTYNPWEGCTIVGPGCQNCYALDRDKRYHGGAHWGPGAPRKRMSEHTRNNPHRWQKKAAEFQRLRGHPQRVFCSSLADIFDNEVPDEWRADAFAAMEATPDLRWQLCTKRVSNIAKMVPLLWSRVMTVSDDRKIVGYVDGWPRNVGVLITVVTPEEVLRDVPRLVELKKRFGIPWIGLSIEPMIADVAQALADLKELQLVDWAIFGGESGREARDCYLTWIIRGVEVCEAAGVSCFVKQLGARAFYAGDTPIKLADPAGKNPEEWPIVPGDVLHTREFPPALC